MSAVVIEYFDWIFESVQFAIDLRCEREKMGMTQLQVAELMSNKSAGVISALEGAKYDNTLSMGDFLWLCNFFELHAADYFEIEPRQNRNS